MKKKPLPRRMKRKIKKMLGIQPEPKPSVYVNMTAENLGISYEEALAKMNEVREKYGVPFSTYVAKHYEQCQTDEEIEAKIKAQKRRNNRELKKLCNVTGWTKEEAKKETERIHEKFHISVKKYYSQELYLLSDEEIEAKLQENKEKRKAELQSMIEMSGWSEAKLKAHMKYAWTKYGIDAVDFRLIKAWRFTREELGELSSVSTTRMLAKKYNHGKGPAILANKLAFDRTYGDLIQRKFWCNDELATYENFCEFLDGLDEFIVKPLDLFQARGVHKVKVPEDKKAMYDDYMSKPKILLEEVIRQHSDINAIYDKSVNTVRIVTLLKDDVCHILCAFMRIGKGGSVVDNMVAGGMIAGVDEETGIVNTGGIDSDGNYHLVHPDTGKAIKGFQIPNFEMVKEIAENGIRKDPGVNYVGWDIAVCQDKAVIIEGNTLPGLMAYQMPYLQEDPIEPKLYKFKPYL